MSPVLQGIVVVVAGFAGALASALFRPRSQQGLDQAEAEEHRAGSAKLLAEAYGLMVDDLREDIADLRTQRDRQDQELTIVRAELKTVTAVRNQEMAAVRLELAEERRENGRLRERVQQLESEVRTLQAS